jgi:hypothetical protein
MTELTNNGSIVAEPSNRFEMSKLANEHRKNGELEKALPLYRELVKDESDSYSAAGFSTVFENFICSMRLCRCVRPQVRSTCYSIGTKKKLSGP